MNEIDLSKMKPLGWYSGFGHKFYSKDWVDEVTGKVGYHCSECEKTAIKKEL